MINLRAKEDEDAGDARNFSKIFLKTTFLLVNVCASRLSKNCVLLLIIIEDSTFFSIFLSDSEYSPIKLMVKKFKVSVCAHYNRNRHI